MFVTFKNNIKRFNCFSQPRIAVVVLTFGNRRINRKMICAELPRFIRIFNVVVCPVCNNSRFVDTHYAEMGVAVIKRVVFRLKTFRTVARIGISELIVKKIRMIKVKFTLRRLRQILPESPVVVISRCHHIRKTFNNSVKARKHSVPLKLVLTVVAVVACCENKSYIRVTLNGFFHHSLNA